MLWGIDQRFKMSYSLPWMSAFQPRPRNTELCRGQTEHRHSAANSRLLFQFITAAPWPPPWWVTGRQEAALGMLIWWEQTRCYRLPHYNISVTSLFFLVARESGSVGRAWWATEAEPETHAHTISATLPLTPPQSVFPFPITAYDGGPTLWFQLQLGRKGSSLQLPAWFEDTVGLYLLTASTW